MDQSEAWEGALISILSCSPKRKIMPMFCSPDVSATHFETCKWSHAHPRRCVLAACWDGIILRKTMMDSDFEIGQCIAPEGTQCALENVLIYQGILYGARETGCSARGPRRGPRPPERTYRAAPHMIQRVVSQVSEPAPCCGRTERMCLPKLSWSLVAGPRRWTDERQSPEA